MWRIFIASNSRRCRVTRGQPQWAIISRATKSKRLHQFPSTSRQPSSKEPAFHKTVRLDSEQQSHLYRHPRGEAIKSHADTRPKVSIRSNYVHNLKPSKAWLTWRRGTQAAWAKPWSGLLQLVITYSGAQTRAWIVVKAVRQHRNFRAHWGSFEDWKGRRVQPELWAAKGKSRVDSGGCSLGQDTLAPGGGETGCNLINAGCLGDQKEDSSQHACSAGAYG